jgi:hypothetical protein
MKDPDVVKLVVDFKQHLTKINDIHQQLYGHDVWVDLQKLDQGQGWEIRHLEQRVKYLDDKTTINIDSNK